MSEGGNIWDQLKPTFRDGVVGLASIFGFNYAKGKYDEYKEKERKELAEEIIKRLGKDYEIKPRDSNEQK